MRTVVPHTAARWGGFFCWLLAAMALVNCSGAKDNGGSNFCFGNGLCVTPGGELIYEDGRRYCEVQGTCVDGGTHADDGSSGSGGSTGGHHGGNGDDGVPVDGPGSNYDVFGDGFQACVCDHKGSDRDQDGISDACEDRNGDGIHGPTELDPDNTDTDGDGLADGLEDENANGCFDLGETSAVRADTDGDGESDGVEDTNRDGRVTAWVDVNADGCFEAGVDTAGEVDPRRIDTDRDGIPDDLEDSNHNGVFDAGETLAFNADTDCDGLHDGIEDRNHDGLVTTGETDPRQADSDGDGIPDGMEDSNKNGRWDEGSETHPLYVDTDGDGIEDGVEVGSNGVYDGFVDTNRNGCWDAGEEGETDPRKRDSDGDGIGDGVEDADHNGVCETINLPDPRRPGQLRVVLTETCGFITDSDCDGLTDGLEDKNHNGRTDGGETSPRVSDTDFDGLTDGCAAAQAQTGQCEDKNNNGTRESDESDPLLADTDGDALSDGCEVLFDVDQSTGVCLNAPCGINPLLLDTDGDGADDGEEDSNHNCRVDAGETDPRHAEPPPGITTEDYAQWSVCAARNLKSLTFAAAQRTTHDYRLAFEVEKEAGGSCPNGLNSECNATLNERCEIDQCVRESTYHIQAFGADAGGSGFNPDDTTDTLYGHVFQSGPGVVHDTVQTSLVLDRDIYGFILQVESDKTLDDLLDDLRADLMTSSAMTSQENGSVTSRPAHDDRGTAFPVLRAQRIYNLNRYVPSAAYSMRNDIMDMLLTRYYNITHDDAEYAIAAPNQDFVHGSVCPGTRCLSSFTVYVGAVKRSLQTGPNGQPVVLITVVLTQNDSNENSPQLSENRWYADRVTRLEDLTGGSAVSRYAAEIGKACERKPRTLAKADLLWVMDDSGSMQAMLRRMQQAADDARAVLSSNANIVDFRVAMTTTNTSVNAKTMCSNASCNEQCGGSGCPSSCPDVHMGCIQLSSLSTQAKIDAVVASANTFPLPGGGGTFYFEDASLFDCNTSSGASSSQLDFINSCMGLPGFSAFYPAQCTTQHACNNISIDYALRRNKGFLGSADTTGCTTATLDLGYAPTTQSGGPAPAESCRRLTLDAQCSDGPSVLTSQICDLMRAMGGLPTQGGGQSTGRRPHSASELGTRSARRLISSLLPRVLDQTPADTNHQTRLRCMPTGTACTNSATCGDGQQCISGSCCTPVPLVTVILSDEEDYYFKDDCLANDSINDLVRSDVTPLQTLCYHMPGSEGVGTACTRAYCEGQDYIPPRCTDLENCNPPWTVSNSPAGLSLDQTAWWSNFTLSFKVRDANAPECDARNNPKACVTDPCWGLTSPQCSAAAGAPTRCSWDANAGACKHRCSALHSNSQETACRADSECRWISSRGGNNDAPACVAAVPFNDCQACKRLRRLDDTVRGGDRAHVLTEEGVWQDVALPGFQDIGPVYAITRNKGQEGSSSDTCGGGSSTYSRGDGLAYHDLSIQTLGRTQDICAPSYRSFMELLIADIVALSAPYRLGGSPIASTIKVGLARSQGDGTFSFVEVPRSRTQGFIYDATTNSIGFKSDPISGQCGAGHSSCTQDEEIAYARTAAHVPREGDIVFISYRLWKAVPCDGECAAGEVCASVMCNDATGPISCTSTPDCPPGYACNDSHQCDRTCTLGDVVRACVSQPSCGACETYDPAQKACVSGGDSCACSSSDAQRCNPDQPQTCAVGQACIGCTCQTISSCLGSIGAYGRVDSCTDALACCQIAKAKEDMCAGLGNQQTCAQNGDCHWVINGGCRSTEPTCCDGNETAQCYRDPETMESALFCKPSCECTGKSCANDPSVCESWQTCDSQTQMCTPACHPTQQFCCEDCGCECRALPN